MAEQLSGEFIGLQAEASKRLLTNFITTGVGDDSLFTYQPVNFHMELGYPALAKLGLASIVLVIVGLVALLWFIVRRVQRRKASQVSSQQAIECWWGKTTR